MDLPNKNTLEIIEERRMYLINKMRESNNNGFVLREIKALDRVINLIRLIQTVADSKENEPVTAEVMVNKDKPQWDITHS